MLTFTHIPQRTITGVLYGLLLLAIASSGVDAQANPDSVKFRNDCRLAIQVLTAGHPSPRTDDALGIIGLCGRDGEQALFKAWNNDAFTETEFGTLVTSTRAVASSRLVDTLFEVASNASYSTVHRVAALLVLTTYADPYRIPSFGHLIGPRDELLHNTFGSIDHPYHAAGLEKLTAPVMPRLLQFLSQMESSDTNPEMRTAARVLLLNLK